MKSAEVVRIMQGDLRVTIYRDGEHYSLMVNGKTYIEQESLTVCENVRDSMFRYPLYPGETVAECDEVAASIMRKVSR